MLHLKEKTVRNNMFLGHFEITKDMLRIGPDGFMSHEPVDGNFDQTHFDSRVQIRSGVHSSLKEAAKSLSDRTREVQTVLKEHDQMLWPFSNPPYIRSQDDIVILNNNESCEYFARKYGKYKMTLCGVNFHFAFDDKLLLNDFAMTNGHNFEEYRDHVYLHLAKQLSLYGWLLTLLSAASPLCDSSYFQKGVFDQNVFGGIASLQNSELGFWNYFTPEFQYTNLQSYVKSIENFVEDDLIVSPYELFFPVRLMPHGEPNFMALKEYGVDHIELNMFDLNPFHPDSIDERDLEFAHLFMIWLCSFPSYWLDRKDSVMLVQNFKNAAHYDLKTVFIRSQGNQFITMLESAVRMIEEMELFFEDEEDSVRDVIAFEKQKCLDVKARYSYQVLADFSSGFVKKGVVQAKKLQDEITKAR